MLPAPVVQFQGSTASPGTSGRWDLKGPRKFLTVNPEPLKAWGVAYYPGYVQAPSLLFPFVARFSDLPFVGKTVDRRPPKSTRHRSRTSSGNSSELTRITAAASRTRRPSSSRRKPTQPRVSRKRGRSARTPSTCVRRSLYSSSRTETGSITYGSRRAPTAASAS